MRRYDIEFIVIKSKCTHTAYTRTKCTHTAHSAPIAFRCVQDVHPAVHAAVFKPLLAALALSLPPLSRARVVNCFGFRAQHAVGIDFGLASISRLRAQPLCCHRLLSPSLVSTFALWYRSRNIPLSVLSNLVRPRAHALGTSRTATNSGSPPVSLFPARACHFVNWRVGHFVRCRE